MSKTRLETQAPIGTVTKMGWKGCPYGPASTALTGCLASSCPVLMTGLLSPRLFHQPSLVLLPELVNRTLTTDFSGPSYPPMWALFVALLLARGRGRGDARGRCGRNQGGRDARRRLPRLHLRLRGSYGTP